MLIVPKTCAGVATTLTATGGSTYSWSTNATTPSVSVSPTSTTTYTVTGTDAKGCSNTANATVTVNPLPNISVNSPTVCSGSTAILAATGGTTYTWSPSGAPGNSITVNAPASATPDTYTVTGTDANGCSNTATSTVRLGTTLLASVNNATICAGETAVLTATGGSNYTWSNNATTPSVSVSPTNTTSYTVTVTNGSGCSGVATATVTVKTAPTIGLNSPTVCAGTNATLIATGGSTYAWSTGASGNVITVNPTTTSGYTVTVTGSNGCTATASTVVTVNNLPNIGLNSATVCAGTNATLVATGGSTYAWSTGASGNVITVNPTTTSGYTVTVTGANGCSNTASTVVTVNALPNLNVSNTAICAGTNATLTASGALSYLWNIGSTSNQIIVSPSTTTNYTVIGTDGNGCKATGTGTVVINPSVNLSVNNPVICAGANATLFATGGTSYMWNTGTMSSVLTVNPTTSTAYSVTATNSYGCSGTATALVTVNALPKVTVPSVAICSGLNTTLLATGAVSYQWSTGATSNPIIVNPTTTTNYSVTGMDANGCSNTAVATVLVNTPPVIGVNSPTICAGTSATLTATGGTSYKWSTNATTPSVSVSPNGDNTITR